MVFVEIFSAKNSLLSFFGNQFVRFLSCYLKGETQKYDLFLSVEILYLAKIEAK